MASWTAPPTLVRNFHNDLSVRRTTYRRLGNTDMIVSKLALGGGPFGGLYGNCDSVEKIVTESALAKIPRNAYYISTKVGRYEQDYGRMFDFRAERVIRSVEESLARLRLPYVDLIQIHDIEFADCEQMILEETLPALECIRHSGKARYIGITGYPLEKLKSVVDKSRIQIDSVLTYSRGTMADQSLTEYVQYFKNEGVDIARLATSFGVNFPGVDTTLIGCNRVDYLHQNLDTNWFALSPKEAQTTQFIMEKYLLPLNNAHWEGIEVQKYWRNAKAASTSKK